MGLMRYGSTYQNPQKRAALMWELYGVRIGAGSGDIKGYGNFSWDGYAIEGDGYI